MTNPRFYKSIYCDSKGYLNIGTDDECQKPSKLMCVAIAGLYVATAINLLVFVASCFVRGN